jgi:hypothetical protein
VRGRSAIELGHHMMTAYTALLKGPR